MAFLFCDGFDHYVTADLAKKWSTIWTGAGNGVAVGAVGRNGGSGLDVNDGIQLYITKTLAPSGASFVIGFARKPTTAGRDGPWFAIGDATVTHLGLQLNADGTFNLRRGCVLADNGLTGGTSLGNTSQGQTLNVYDYWEISGTIHASAGAVTIRKNNIAVLTLTGINTLESGGSAGWTWFGFGRYNLGDLAYYDDVYALDGSGSAPHNTFYGDVRVSAHVPNANGANSGSTPSTGSDRYATVDEAAPNSDTDYNSLTTVGSKDTLGMQNLIPAGAAIVAYQVIINAKKSDSGAGSICPVIRHSGTDYDGTAAALSTAYTAKLTPYENNPGTSAQMTEADFNALEVGYKRTV